MHRRLIQIATQIALLALLLLLPTSAHATSSLSQAQVAAHQLQAQIAVLDGQMKTADGRYTFAKQQLTQVQSSMVANQRQLGAIEARLASDQMALAQHVVATYETPATAILDVVLSTASFSDLISNLNFMAWIGQQGAALVSSVKAARGQLAEQRVTLLRQRNQVAQLVGQIARQETQIERATQARQTMLTRAQAKVKLILQQIAAAKAAAAARAAAAAAAAARAAAAAAAAARSEQAAQAPLPANSSPGGASGDYTPQTWAQALLRDAHLPTTTANLSAIVAWEMAEGGNWYNGARYNPLDTTMPEPGASDMNAVGVKAYASWSEGLTATIATLENGDYANIIAALRAGQNAAAVAAAVAVSPWGTQPFSLP
ncbi:MAG: coiled-coil domain-containing protein [Thermoleophilia bacterium]